MHCCRQKSRKPKTMGGLCICVCVLSLATLRVRFPVCLVLSLYMIHMKQTSWDADDIVFLTAVSNSLNPQFPNADIAGRGGGGGGRPNQCTTPSTHTCTLD
jgi:hypothetical protein